MNYLAIEKETISQLNKAVNECIRDGFVPQGGIAVNKENGKTYYIQAMISKEMK